MLSIISMNRAGLSDGCLSVKVDFEFDNASTLPERVVTVSGMSYIIAKDSTAKNIVTNVNYKYTGSKWVKVTETVEPVTGGTITDNGDYTITSNEYTGLSDISVDVADSSTFMDKTVTENGTYTASDDSVSGYSSVSVDVAGKPVFSIERVSIAPINPDFTAQFFSSSLFTILSSEDGIYEVSRDVLPVYNTGTVTFANPLKKFQFTDTTKEIAGIFTPAEDYDGFYLPDGNKIPIKEGSSTITPGDGKGYIFKIINEYGNRSVQIKKESTGYDYIFRIS